MEPSNDHERELARLIDAHAQSVETLDYTVVLAVAKQLKFMMDRADSQFLISYVHWRMNNPIWKP